MNVKSIMLSEKSQIQKGTDARFQPQGILENAKPH